MMLDLFSQTLSGVASGMVYGSLALSLVIIYRTTTLLNFAQGEMAMLSAYLAWSLLKAGLPYWAAFCITVAASFLFGMLVERVLIRPVANAPALTTITISVGLFIIFNSVAGWIFSYSTKTFDSPFPTTALFHGQPISTHELGVITTIFVVMFLVFAFFRWTRLGLAMRAAAENPLSCQLAGVPVPFVRGIGWGLAATIGAVAGMMIAPIVYLDPNMMFGVLIYALAAATLGGIDSPLGAIAGGLLIGVVENLSGAYLVGPDLKTSVALCLIVIVLLVRPAGLFGTRVVKRV